jgi:hypothetical protein
MFKYISCSFTFAKGARGQQFFFEARGEFWRDEEWSAITKFIYIIIRFNKFILFCFSITGTQRRKYQNMKSPLTSNKHRKELDSTAMSFGQM